MHRRWLRWALWTIGAIVALVAAAYFVIESSWGRERVLAVMVDRANRAMRGELRVEALHGSVLGDTTFRGVTLTLNGETVFAADSVRAQFSVWQLMFDEVGLEALTVVRPRIRATETNAGWNIAKILPERDPDSPRSKFEFSIDRVAVIDGDVEVRAQGAEARRMQNVQIETGFDYSAGTVAMEVDRAEVYDPDADVALRSFDGRVQIGDAGVAVSDMHAVTAASEAKGDIAYATNGETARELRFAVDAPRVALREVAAYVPELRKYPSDTMVTATARGTLAEMTADWTLESSAGRGRGRIEGGQRDGAMTLRGEADVTGFDPSAWLDNRTLEGRLDARGNFALAWRTENPAATMDARFDATASSVQLAGYRAANLRTSGTFAHGTLNATAAGQAYGATIDGRGTWQQRSDTWSARGRFANVNLRALPRSLQVPALASRLAGEASLSGGPSRLVAEATLAESVVEDATIGRDTVVRVDKRGKSLAYTARGTVSNLDPKRIIVALEEVPAELRELDGRVNARFDINATDSRLVVEATLAESVVEDATIATDTFVRIEKQGPSLAYVARGAVANLDPKRIAAVLKDAPPALRDLDARINARFDVDARGTTLDTLEGRATVDVENSVVSGVAVEALHATADLLERRLVAAAKVRVNDLTNRAVGVGDAAEFVASGTADVNVTIEDITTPIPLEMIAGRAAVTLDKAVIRGVALDRVQLDADVAQGLARVTTLQAEGAALRAEAGGQVAFAGNSQSDLKYTIDVRDLSAFETLAERPLAGNAQLDGVLTGPAGSATATGTLAAHELVAGPLKALVANSKYTVQMPDFDVARIQADATTTATFIEVGDTRLDRVEAKIKYEKEQLDLDATIEEGKRSVRVAGLVVPHPEHREAHVRQLDLVVADTKWTLPAGREAVIQYGENTLTVRGFELTNGPARLQIEGSLTPGASGASTTGIDFLVEAMRLEDLNAILLSERQITGRIDASGRLTGSLKAPEVTAQLKVTEGRMQDIPYNSLIGNVSYATERLTLDINLDAGTAGQLTAKGTMPVKLGEASTTGTPPYDLQVNSSAMQVGLLQPLIPAVTSLAGTAQVNVHVTGPADSPRIDGTVGITGATFDVVETGVRYQQLNADLFLEGQGLTVRQLSVLDSQGRPATVQGALKLPGFRSTGEFELKITANEFLVLNNDMGEVAVDLNLQASGTTAAPKITGSIEIERGRLELGTLLDQFAAPGYKAAAAPAGEPETAAKVPEGPYGNSTLELSVVLPDNVVVRGRGLRSGDAPIGLGDLNITLGGTLTVTKQSGAEPQVLGRVNVVRGNYDFQGRRFAIERDSGVQFRGDLTSPTLDIRAEREIQSVVARVRVTGTLERPEITLSSSPPLDQGDILSLIVFNQPINELQTNERVSLAARAGALAASAIATPIADSVARALDLDVFEIKPSSDISTGGAITIGRQLNDNLFVGFQQQFGSQEVSKLSFEYRLTEFIRIVTAFAQGSSDRATSIARAEAAGIDLVFVIRR